MRSIDFALRGEYITARTRCSRPPAWPAAAARPRRMVADGRVQVDGRDELRKTCKIRAGQVVAVTGARVRVMADPDAPPA